MKTIIDEQIKLILRENLSEHIAKNQLTYSKVAELSGMDPRNLPKILSGAHGATVERLLKIAWALGLTFDLQDLRYQARFQIWQLNNLENEVNEFLQDLQSKGVLAGLQMNKLRTYLIERIENGGERLTNVEIEDLVRYVTLKVAGAQFRKNIPGHVSVLRFHTNDGFEFVRTDDRAGFRFTVSEPIMFSFVKRYGKDAFYEDVVATSFVQDNEVVIDVMDQNGAVLWVNESI